MIVPEHLFGRAFLALALVRDGKIQEAEKSITDIESYVRLRGIKLRWDYRIGLDELIGEARCFGF